MELEDLDIWSSNKAADIVFDVCIRHKLRFFGFKILAAPEHCFMIDWGDGTKYICQGEGEWRYFSYDYRENENVRECRVAIYAGAGCEILGLDLTCTDVYERYVTNLDTSRCPSLRELLIEDSPTLDLSCNRHLKVLRCELPLFDILDIGSNAELEELYIRGSGRNMKFLDVSGCPNLKALTCQTMDIERLYLESNTELEELDVNGCYNLKSLDLSVCRKLRHLDCSGCTALAEIKLPDPTVLEYVLYDDSGIIGRREDWFLKCLLKQKKTGYFPHEL